MFRLFKKEPVPPSSAKQVPTPDGFLQPHSAAILLDTQHRQQLIERIWQRTALSRSQFTTLFRQPFDRYAALVQALPASEKDHHAYAGGMLDHGLERVAFALKLRQSHLLPVGASPEEQAAQADVWTAATAYAALLHNLGKIVVDLHVELLDGSIWHPWHGPLSKPYRFRYRERHPPRLQGAATGLLYAQILDRGILDWLSGYHEVWSSLMYALTGQLEYAGVLGDLVTQADQTSATHALGDDPSLLLRASTHTLRDKEDAQHLMPFNDTHNEVEWPGFFDAPESWTDADSSTADGIEAAMPCDANQASYPPSGKAFIAWLREIIRANRLTINDTQALVYTVADTVFLVSPGVFQRYAQEHPAVSEFAKEAQLNEWQWVQRQFERLHIHRKHPGGLNIWTYTIAGPKKAKRLHGYLLTTHATLFDEQLPNNPHLTLVDLPP